MIVCFASVYSSPVRIHAIKTLSCRVAFIILWVTLKIIQGAVSEGSQEENQEGEINYNVDM